MDSKSSNGPSWKQQGSDAPCSNDNNNNVPANNDVSRQSITNAVPEKKDDSVRLVSIFSCSSCKKQGADKAIALHKTLQKKVRFKPHSVHFRHLAYPKVYNLCTQEKKKDSGSEWQAVSKEDDAAEPTPFHISSTWESLIQLPIDMNQQEDGLLAMMLQEEEDTKVKAKQEETEEKERICMTISSTRTGRACLFVQKVVAITNELLANVTENHYSIPEQNHPEINAIANDAMVLHAERLLSLQDDFRESNKPILVDIGYHYTTQRAIESIKTKSLASRQELLEQGIRPRSSRGAFFGDGIYTANNPFAFRRCGPEGLLVARIHGVTRRAVRAQRLVPHDGSFDTIIGNKATSNIPSSCVEHYDEVVLLNSSQCLPLVHYSSRIIRRNCYATRADTDSPIRIFHIAMQQIVDEFFNEGKSTADWTAVKLPPAASVNSGPMISQSQDPLCGNSWYTPNDQLCSAGVASGQASAQNLASASLAATRISSKRHCSHISVSWGT